MSHLSSITETIAVAGTLDPSVDSASLVAAIGVRIEVGFASGTTFADAPSVPVDDTT